MYITIQLGSINDLLISLKTNKDKISKFRYISRDKKEPTIKEFSENRKIDFIADFTTPKSERGVSR